MRLLNRKTREARQRAVEKKTRFKFGPKYARLPIKLSLITNLLIVIFVGVTYPFLQPEVPLFYSLPQGSLHLVSKGWLFLLPAISLLINLLHIGLINSFSIHQLVVKLFAWADFILQIILLMVSVRNVLIIW